jgi:TPR repeat protein
LGVPQDAIASYAYLNIAAANGDGEFGKNCVKLRDLLQKELTPDQIEKAQELSSELYKKIEENKKKAEAGK